MSVEQIPIHLVLPPTLHADRQRLIALARAELQVREDDGNNRDKAGRIQTYWDDIVDPDSERWIGYKPGADRRNEWCAAFASFIYNQAGYPFEHRKGKGYYGCGMLIHWLMARDAFLRWDQWEYACPGDLLFFDWQRLPKQLRPGVELTADRAAQVVDHVGIVEKVDVSARVVHTIEGNWNGGVNRTQRKIDALQIVGFGSVLPETNEETDNSDSSYAPDEE